jgi:hypothetical protein
MQINGVNIIFNSDPGTAAVRCVAFFDALTAHDDLEEPP